MNNRIEFFVSFIHSEITIPHSVPNVEMKGKIVPNRSNVNLNSKTRVRNKSKLKTIHHQSKQTRHQHIFLRLILFIYFMCSIGRTKRINLRLVWDVKSIYLLCRWQFDEHRPRHQQCIHQLHHTKNVTCEIIKSRNVSSIFVDSDCQLTSIKQYFFKLKEISRTIFRTLWFTFIYFWNERNSCASPKLRWNSSLSPTTSIVTFRILLPRITQSDAKLQWRWQSTVVIFCCCFCYKHVICMWVCVLCTTQNL